jgi:hypothetical protein
MENYSVRQLCKLSGYSAFKLNGIKDYWLEKIPKEESEYSEVGYMVYDATYFHKEGCLLNLMNADNQKIIAHRYVKKEAFLEVYPWFSSLKGQGLNPQYITTDGERSVMRAMRLVWPEAKLQRCLFHLQREGMRWLRSYPKTEAGKQLRILLSKLSWIKTVTERDAFIEEYGKWLKKYGDYIKSLPNTTVACKDLKRTVGLINNALPDMFYYLQDQRVHPTTNALEGFHSRMKTDYQRHRGLTKEHKISYIHWYIYFKNGRN